MCACVRVCVCVCECVVRSVMVRVCYGTHVNGSCHIYIHMKVSHGTLTNVIAIDMAA